MSPEKLKPAETDRRSQLREAKPLVYQKILKFKEKLSNGESIGIIQLQYNYACNFACQHCSIRRFQGQGKERQLMPADIKDLFHQADEIGLARVTITGGEPLVFKDFDQLVAAIDPTKFWINCDTNGWFLDEVRARHLKAIGVDRIQLSLDSLDAKEHDAFRGKKGAHDRALRAVEAAWKAGLAIFIQTVVTKQRLYSDELMDFIHFFNDQGIGVFLNHPKPVGAWEKNFEVLLDRQDIDYIEKELVPHHQVFTHLTPAYGINMGCIAVKGIFSVTQYGDVLPCPWIHVSLGNIFEEPLKDILDRGLQIKYFGERTETCLMGEDRDFIKKVAAGTYDQPLPVKWNKVFGPKERTKKPFNKESKLFNES
jgi:MoaA/NifB/PqqE/SkfB family radical SAM enzyme